VLWHCWLGYLTCKIVSEMTYNVSSGTINPTIPCRTIQSWMCSATVVLHMVLYKCYNYFYYLLYFWYYYCYYRYYRHYNLFVVRVERRLRSRLSCYRSPPTSTAVFQVFPCLPGRLYTAAAEALRFNLVCPDVCPVPLLARLWCGDDQPWCPCRQVHFCANVGGGWVHFHAKMEYSTS